MKLDYKIEGSKVKIIAQESFSSDSDNDGEVAVLASLSAEIEINGEELLSELLKDNDLFKKAKALIGMK